MAVNRRTTIESDYFKLLSGEYALISTAAKSAAPEAVTVIDEIIRKQQVVGEISWGDLHIYDKALLMMLPREQLECRFPVIVDMYQEIAGDKHRDGRVRIPATELGSVSDELLRKQLGELADDIAVHLSLYAECRKYRSSIMKRLLYPMLVVFAAILSFVYFRDGEFPPLVYVIVSGSIGSLVSLIRRLQNSAGTDTNALNYLDLKYDRLSIYLTPAYGMIFSVILFLFFTSGLLTGDVFPSIMTPKDFEEESDVWEVMSNFVIGTYPLTGKDCAKMIIWSFIAGFAEQFVPDTLNRLITRADDTKGNAQNAVS